VKRAKGTPEQVRAFDEARRALEDNAERERKAGIRDETGTFLDLNDRVIETEGPLSPWQRSYFASDWRMARADRAQRRAARRSSR
jgi:hypothetical protein